MREQSFNTIFRSFGFFCVALLGTSLAGCEAQPLSGRVSTRPRNYTSNDASVMNSDAQMPIDQGTMASTDAAPADAGHAPDAFAIVDTGSVFPDAGFMDAAAPPPPDAGMSMLVCGDGRCTAPSEDCQTCMVDCGPCNWPSAQAAEEDAMVGLVNQLRATGATCGSTTHAAVGPVVMNAQLRQAARDHSQDMADQDYFEHDSLDGRTPWTRIAATGYQGSPVGENIAAGNRVAQQTFSQWVYSPGHCRNMMNGNANEMGVGYAVGQGRFTHYWTQNFGRR
jgi:uncharacterized protein YkwD